MSPYFHANRSRTIGETIKIQSSSYFWTTIQSNTQAFLHCRMNLGFRQSLLGAVAGMFMRW